MKGVTPTGGIIGYTPTEIMGEISTGNFGQSELPGYVGHSEQPGLTGIIYNM